MGRLTSSYTRYLRVWIALQLLVNFCELSKKGLRRRPCSDWTVISPPQIGRHTDVAILQVFKRLCRTLGEGATGKAIICEPVRIDYENFGTHSRPFGKSYDSGQRIMPRGSGISPFNKLAFLLGSVWFQLEFQLQYLHLRNLVPDEKARAL